MTQVVALEFSRSPQWFLDCLVRGDALEKHRSAMLEVGRQCVFGMGEAKMIVSPEEVNDVLFHISTAGITFGDKNFAWDDLQRRHIIVGLGLEADVMKALEECSGTGQDGGRSKDKARVRQRVVIDIPSPAWHSQADEGFDTANLFVHLSF